MIILSLKHKAIFLVCLSFPFISHAQKCYFNTIGKIERKTEMVNQINDTSQDSPEVDCETVTMDSIAEISTETFKRVRPLVALPLSKIHVNSPFGRRNDPMNRKKARVHNGLDLRARFENVYAMLPGTVIDAGNSENGGNYVKIQHGICTCIYLHLSKILVRQGQHVTAGQVVAISGNSGKRTTGPHLHISCKWSDNGKYFDPKVLLGYIASELQKNKQS